MMNTIYITLLLASIIMLTIIEPDKVYYSMINGATSAVKLTISLVAIYSVCMTIIDIMSKVGADKVIHRAFRPLTKRLFRDEDEKTRELISMNLSMNLLGMGGAATPLGMQAVARMQKDSTKASDNAILFTIINATSIQLLPTTIIGMRASHGSISPADIILPTLISTSVATVVGVLISLALRRRHG